MNTNKPLQNIRLGWSLFVVITITTLTIIAISIYYLSNSSVTFFQDLFYFPIIIACAYYTKMGFAFSVVLSFIYLFLIISFTRDSTVTIEALIRVFMFVGIAGVTTFLSIIRKRNEEKTEKLNVELSAIVKELGAFSYSVSHDLKAHLRAIAGFSSILSEEYAPKLDDNGRRLIGVINDNTRVMEQLIDDLLKLARMAKQPIDVVNIDMTTLAQSVCHELEEGFSRDRVIEVSVKPLPPARADYTLVRQIFTNLISNAMKFTAHKDKAVIEIGGYDKDGDCVYYVKDNGAGFDMKYKDKLFGVFQRLHGQDEFSGTGVGLAIVSNAVLRHGGKAWAQGQVDKGATFYFTLPKGEQNEQIRTD